MSSILECIAIIASILSLAAIFVLSLMAIIFAATNNYTHFVCNNPVFPYIYCLKTISTISPKYNGCVNICLTTPITNNTIINSTTVYQYATEEPDLQKNEYYRMISVYMGITVGILCFVTCLVGCFWMKGRMVMERFQS